MYLNHPSCRADLFLKISTNILTILETCVRLQSPLLLCFNINLGLSCMPKIKNNNHKTEIISHISPVKCKSTAINQGPWFHYQYTDTPSKLTHTFGGISDITA